MPLHDKLLATQLVTPKNLLFIIDRVNKLLHLHSMDSDWLVSNMITIHTAQFLHVLHHHIMVFPSEVYTINKLNVLRFPSHHITSHHITSHHITSHHMIAIVTLISLEAFEVSWLPLRPYVQPDIHKGIETQGWLYHWEAPFSSVLPLNPYDLVSIQHALWSPSHEKKKKKKK